MIYLNNNGKDMREYVSNMEIATINERLHLKGEKLTELQENFIRHLILFNVDTKEEEKDLIEVLFTLLVQRNTL